MTKIETIEGLRKDIRLALLPFIGETVDEMLAEAAAVKLKAVLPSSVKPNALCQTLYLSRSDELTEGRAATLAARLAGNTALLRAGKPVPPWQGEYSPDTWYLMQVHRARWVEGRFRIDSEVMEGPPSGHLIPYRCSKFSYFARAVGVSSRKLKGLHVSDLMFLWFQGRLTEAEKSGSVFLRDARATTATRKQNKDVLRCRLETCPHDRSIPCYQCKAGRGLCPGAVRRLTIRE